METINFDYHVPNLMKAQFLIFGQYTEPQKLNGVYVREDSLLH